MNPKALGMKSTRLGHKTMMATPITMMRMKGKRPLNTSSIPISAIEQPINRHKPTGGVIWPIAKDVVVTIPKCSGCMPN
jgi:hypothetical protein